MILIYWLWVLYIYTRKKPLIISCFAEIFPPVLRVVLFTFSMALFALQKNVKHEPCLLSEVGTTSPDPLLFCLFWYTLTLPGLLDFDLSRSKLRSELSCFIRSNTRATWGIIEALVQPMLDFYLQGGTCGPRFCEAAHQKYWAWLSARPLTLLPQ